MKLLLSAFLLVITTSVAAQLEISSGVAVNKNEAIGFPVHIGYDFQLNKRLYTKSQIGYKFLKSHNDYVGATLTVSTWELHQTVSYEVVSNRKYILKPNIGVNYRFYKWNGEMDPPYNTLPQRAWVIGTRDDRFILNSYDDGFSNTYQVSNIGFSIQLQNQFKLSSNVWLHLAPFIEPDYDRSHNTGGCYIGAIFKSI